MATIVISSVFAVASFGLGYIVGKRAQLRQLAYKQCEECEAPPPEYEVVATYPVYQQPSQQIPSAPPQSF